jgi:peptide/nickel transport system substrate-binding protein/oligopeptide transport system substrate-binding protein
VAAGCTSSNTPASTAPVVVKINLGEPQSLIPSNTAETSGSQVLAALYEPLIAYDAQVKPVNAAAESVDSSDKIHWTIKLKQDRTFSNGEKVTADSYINAWNYAAYGDNGQNNNYFFAVVEGYDPMQDKGSAVKALTGLKKVDDYTISVTLTSPFAQFPLVLGYTGFYPLPSVAWSSPGVLDPKFEDSPIGDGPFKMNGSWQHDTKISVTKWDGFKGTQPKVDGVDFIIYTSLDTAYQDLLANNLDVLTSIPTASLTSASTDLGDRFQQSPSSTFQYLAFPVTNPKYSNANVRKAISMAIDRDEEIQKVFNNTQSSADAFVSPVVAGYRKGACGDACKFDPAAAKALYQANGGPASISIAYNADGGHKEWVDATCNQLQNNLGITCVGNPFPKFADLLNKLKAGEDIGFFRLGWVMDYPSMQDYLEPLYATGGSSNYYGYSNKAFDDLVHQGDAASSDADAIKLYQQAEDILAKDVPVIPMRFGKNTYGFSTNVKNVVLTPFSFVDLYQIEKA